MWLQDVLSVSRRLWQVICPVAPSWGSIFLCGTSRFLSSQFEGLAKVPPHSMCKTFHTQHLKEKSNLNLITKKYIHLFSVFDWILFVSIPTPFKFWIPSCFPPTGKWPENQEKMRINECLYWGDLYQNWVQLFNLLFVVMNLMTFIFYSIDLF